MCCCHLYCTIIVLYVIPGTYFLLMEICFLFVANTRTEKESEKNLIHTMHSTNYLLQVVKSMPAFPKCNYISKFVHSSGIPITSKFTPFLFNYFKHTLHSISSQRLIYLIIKLICFLMISISQIFSSTSNRFKTLSAQL